MRDSEEGQTRKEKRPRIVGFRGTAERRDRFKVETRRVSTISGQSRVQDPWDDERERIAYERIARSFKPGKRG